MTSTPFELPAANIPGVETEDSFEPIDATRLRGYAILKLTNPQLEKLREAPDSIVQGFIEDKSIQLHAKGEPQTYFSGKVPSARTESQWERVALTVRKPGRVSRGLYKAISLIKEVTPPATKLQVDPFAPYQPEERQLTAFEANQDIF